MPDAGNEGLLASHVDRVLRRVWDPIGLGAPGPADEYEAYVPDLVALTQDSTVFEDALVAHLVRIEVEAMRLSLPPAKRTRAARSHRNGWARIAGPARDAVDIPPCRKS